MSAPPPVEASVEALRPGGLRCAEALWRGMHDRLESFVSRRGTPSVQDTEDIVQDVFLRMHLAIEGAQRIERFDAWMYSVARNAVIDGHRRRRTSDPLAEDEHANDERDNEPDDLRRELADCLLPFVDRLPEPYAQAVRWADVEGVSQVEAARRAGISVPGMKSRVQRGRARLRELVDACCRFELDVRGRVVGFEAKHACGCNPGP